MRALRITLAASMAGWFTGFAAGSVVGLPLALTIHYRSWTWSTLTMVEVVWSEVVWAFSLAIGMLPACALLVWPVVFHQLRKPVRWHPFQAFWIGGAGGIVAFGLGLALFIPSGAQFNWSRPDERVTAWLAVVTAFLIGAVIGSVAASMARDYPAVPPMPGSVPPPMPRSDH